MDALKFVMQFYGVSESDALEYYSDEIDAAQRLIDAGLSDEIGPDFMETE